MSFDNAEQDFIVLNKMLDDVLANNGIKLAKQSKQHAPILNTINQLIYLLQRDLAHKLNDPDVKECFPKTVLAHSARADGAVCIARRCSSEDNSPMPSIQSLLQAKRSNILLAEYDDYGVQTESDEDINCKEQKKSICKIM